MMIKRKKDKQDDLIINRPEAMSSLRRKSEITVTTVGWIVWVFICRPLLIVFLWFIGFQFFFEHMVNLGGLIGLREMGAVYISIILGVYFIVRGWNVYNKMRYGGRNKRVGKKSTTNEELEEFFKLPARGIMSIQAMDTVDIDFEDDHTISVRVGGESSTKKIEGKFRPT